MLFLLTSLIIHLCSLGKLDVQSQHLTQESLTSPNSILHSALPNVSPTPLDTNLTESLFNARRIAPPRLKTNTL